MTKDKQDKLKERAIAGDTAAAIELKEIAKRLNAHADQSRGKVAQILRQRAGEIERFLFVNVKD